MQLALTKSRLTELLDLYLPGVEIEEVGGYDTGVYFSFRGTIRKGALPEDRHCGGRIVRQNGFCSESLVITRRELFLPSKAGIGLFLARVGRRRKTLERWLDQYQAKSRPANSRKHS